MDLVKIKLFIDAHVFDGIYQGTVSYIAGLYSEIAKDDRFQLYVGSEDIETAKLFLQSDNFIHVKYTSSSKFTRLFFEIPYALKKMKIDYAHFQYISPISKKCKYIVTIHDLLFLEFPKNFPLFYKIKNCILFYVSSKRADIVTTVSLYSKNSINKLFKIPFDKILITPNAIKKSQIKCEINMELTDKKFILYVSRIEPRKNQALLISIWKELKQTNKDLCLVLVGSEGVRDCEFDAEIQKLNNIEREHFRWYKSISIEKLVWLYENCSIFVFPSSAEGFGIPPIEAAYYGAKVICSDATAMSEFDFFDKYFFSPNDRDEFKQKILQVIDSPYPHSLIRKEIELRYNWETIAKEFSDNLFVNHIRS